MTYQNPHNPGCPWHSITESQGAPNIKWCEETLCQWISEPANTWSNLGYLIVAVIMTYLAIKKKEPFNLKIFGPIIFFMGAMSFYYHLSNFYGSQILDFVGMFFFVGWAIGMNFIRLDKLKSEKLVPFVLVFSLLMTGIMHWMYLTNIKFQMLVLISGIIILITEIAAQKKQHNHMKWFWTTIGILIVAFGFSISDGQRLWCSPKNHGWFSQGHALWHWTAAIGMFTIYKHYSQEVLSLRA
ncbi:MAG: ceramidase domain-containing protein [Bacteriovoracia bacterium]